MTDVSHENSLPIDAVITWVDGSDPRLTEKRNRYLKDIRGSSHPGAHPTRFASVNEIRYCVLSILKFAPFVRNLFIVTDGQDPNLYEEIKTLSPERLSSLRIIDHKEIFRGYENYLPTFNSLSIESMIWRIKDLSDNFIYFNDDLFLIRDHQPDDWFRNDNPVLRGKWRPVPLHRIFWNSIRKTVNKYLLNNADFQPTASFHMGQWNSATLLGFRCRYFANRHTPHPVGRKVIEDFFNHNKKSFERNISFRFRNWSQFTMMSLSNHLQILNGNRLIANPDLAYLKPYNRPDDYLDKKIRFCESNPGIKFICVQSLEMCKKEDQEKILGWMDRILGLEKHK